jgi:hypothetical protein
MTLLLSHAGATLAMVGLIWFVQVVHYPLFDHASERRFVGFAAAHQRRTSWVVVPLMLTEAGTALALLITPPPGVRRELLWLGVLLLAVIWLSTALLQVPLHRRLSGGRDASAIRRLVASNWLRTAAWTARGWLALALLKEASR